MVRQSVSPDESLEAGDQAFQYQGSLAGSGDAGDRGQPAFRNIRLQRFYRVDGAGGKVNGSQGKEFLGRCTGALLHACLSGEKGADLGERIIPQLSGRPAGYDAASILAGTRSHLDDPVGFGQNLGVVVHQYHRVSVGNQIVHDAGQSLYIGGMKTDGGLIQHIENPGGAVSHGPGQLHALSFSGGERGGGPVQSQIP